MITLPAEAAQLQSWWFDARENQLVFATDASIQPQAQMIFNPTRIVIDLPGTTLGRPSARQAVGGAIREVRSGQFDAQTARLVIELNPGYTMDPRAVRVQGLANNRWAVQLPPAQRGETTTVTPTVGNAVTGEVARGAQTYLDAVLATPDGFFIRTRGQKPDISIDRSGESGRERRIVIELEGTSISPLLRQASLPNNRYSVSRWEIIQDTQAVKTRVIMTLAPRSPDWEITQSDLGGIVMVPPGGVSISSIPDQRQRPGGNQTINVPQQPPQPQTPPPQPQIPNNLPRAANGELLVVIDPGHGGRDPGAVGIGGLQEKNVIFPMSLRVAEILRSQGVQVVLTRTDDRTLGLESRVDIANQVNGSVFLSIHANAISLSRPDVNGVETYYASNAGRGLARIIHANVLPVSGMRDRGVKEARFYVLRHTDMPAALLEVGFVTGVEDVPKLRDPNWREQMSQAIARGILQYLEPFR
ncbi:MAG: N-acetylmuramoyl-L-alanine amidase [Cyanobacteria bacterium J06638_28]